MQRRNISFSINFINILVEVLLLETSTIHDRCSIIFYVQEFCILVMAELVDLLFQMVITNSKYDVHFRPNSSRFQKIPVGHYIPQNTLPCYNICSFHLWPVCPESQTSKILFFFHDVKGYHLSAIVFLYLPIKQVYYHILESV